MRDGQAVAARLARRWGFEVRGADLLIQAENIHSLYRDLIRLCYLTPLIERLLPLSLALFNLQGRFGLAWLRRRLKEPSIGEQLVAR
jgi:hypothetical protein